ESLSFVAPAVLSISAGGTLPASIATFKAVIEQDLDRNGDYEATFTTAAVATAAMPITATVRQNAGYRITLDGYPASNAPASNGGSVAGGGSHSLALKSDGTVWNWGNNSYGQLGDGTVTQRTTPVKTSLITTAVEICAGDSHSAALLANGTIMAWGRNDVGQLGDSTTSNRTTPVAVVNP
ncbi:MAG: hypothetical protein FJZ00_07205, partial [Candidatus Sericytochromatia bacterium]|nr:hypothetical protein [Candidatus Tanganyikabacteria bacterium]